MAANFRTFSIVVLVLHLIHLLNNKFDQEKSLSNAKTFRSEVKIENLRVLPQKTRYNSDEDSLSADEDFL